MRKTTIKTLFILLPLGLVLLIGLYYTADNPNQDKPRPHISDQTSDQDKDSATTTKERPEKGQDHPMAIENLRTEQYPGGDLDIKQTLSNGSNYERYIASYNSEGLEINGLLTVPLSDKPEGGYPAVVFLHGYIPPDQYSTVDSYPTYQAALARAGFITYKPDLRGHADSEGSPVDSHTSPEYIIDTMNAISYLQDHPQTDPERIGYWGHSNGGEIGLRVLTISQDIKAAVFWAGVVGNYEDMMETYVEEISFLDPKDNELVQKYGLPSKNPEFWKYIDPYEYLDRISAPVQLQHATGDESVPVELSQSLKKALEEAGKNVEYYEYQGDDHNISQNSNIAWRRSIDFFQKNLTRKNSSVSEEELVAPLDKPEQRITEKPFGIFITPENSPIEEERFSGYHTGVDWEVFDSEIGEEVPVKAICSGDLISKQYVSGYGGVAVQECRIDKNLVTVIYGHLDLGSIKISEGKNMETGEKFGYLGEHKSEETDGERKHLHLGIHKGKEMNLAGYVDSKNKLSAWIDPCLYFCGSNRNTPE